MARVIGQRYEVYNYQQVKDEIPRRGETIIVNNTPDHGASAVTLLGNGKKTVETLYQEWNNGMGSPFRTAADQDVIDAGINTALAKETAARRKGDITTLAAAKSYTDEAQLATQTWLPAVNTKAALPVSGLVNTINYLCRVIADADNNGVYQAVAGWDDEPVWTYFSDNADWIDELELKAAIDEHNENETAHEDIRETIAAEVKTLQDQIDILAPEGLENLPELLARKADRDFVEEQVGTRLSEVFRDASLLGNGTETEPLGIAPKKFGVGFSETAADEAEKTATVPNFVKEAGSAVGIIFAEANTAETPTLDVNGTGAAAIQFNGAAVSASMLGKGAHYFLWNESENGDDDGEESENGDDDKVEGYWQLLNPATEAADRDYPIGSSYVQYPNDDTPVERGLPGNWMNWTQKAEIYGLSLSLPATMPAYTTNSASISSGSYRLVTLADGDQEVYQARTAISANPGTFNPINWRPLGEVSTTSYRPIFVARKDVQSSWTEDDLVIGASVTYNGVTYLVSAIHKASGKFPSFAGGNRPPFVSGGVRRDVSRNITGSYAKTTDDPFTREASNTINALGAIGQITYTSSNSFSNMSGTNTQRPRGFDFDASRVIPTGPEFSPNTLSVILWRRVS
jgi:hypothetical protein